MSDPLLAQSAVDRLASTCHEDRSAAGACPFLARILGIHIDVAVALQRASAGDWMTYAADIARRPSKETS